MATKIQIRKSFNSYQISHKKLVSRYPKYGYRLESRYLRTRIRFSFLNSTIRLNKKKICVKNYVAMEEYRTCVVW